MKLDGIVASAEVIVVAVVRGQSSDERVIAMVSVGLFVRLEAKPGKETEVGEFLRAALPLVQDEVATTAWFAFRFSSSSFGIFDVFPDAEGRQAHLAGRVAAALLARAGDLLAAPPAIEKVDTLASKLAPQ